jgi:acyl-CoA synthetase (AMP-forming)/AMP-acid ligase II
VVVAPGADVATETILAHCREELALYKIPRGVHYLEALPKSAAGKVQRRDLAALA